MPANNPAASSPDETDRRNRRRRTNGGEPEPGHRDRMARHPTAATRPRRRGRSHRRPRARTGSSTPCRLIAETCTRRFHRTLHQHGVAVEWVSERSRGWTQRRPWRSSGKARSAGEAMPRGWIAEQMSWTNPGSVRTALRVPPPAVGCPSTTRTRRPVRAIVIAATSPLGPDPMTMASYRSLRSPATRPLLAAPRLAPRRSHRSREYGGDHGRRASAASACSTSSTGESRSTSSSAPSC